MAQIVKRQSSCGRGVLKLKSWNPLPRPGQSNDTQQQQQTTQLVSGVSASKSCSKTNNDKIPKTIDSKSNTAVYNGSASKSKMTDSLNRQNQQMTKVLVKYNYKANPQRPGGFDELSIKQGEYIYFHEVNPSNPFWVKAENNQGAIGYVPTEYIMKIETKSSQLPWLENRRLQREAEREKEEQNRNRGFGAPGSETLPPRKYISAYNTEESTMSSDFSCQLCGKIFNGPKPYRLHMASKAHKEEEEAQASR